MDQFKIFHAKGGLPEIEIGSGTGIQMKFWSDLFEHSIK